MRISYIISLILLIPTIVIGQSKSQAKIKADQIESINSFVRGSIFKNSNIKVIPDSIAIHTFMIDIHVKKSEKNSIVKDIVTKDSIVFQIFPDLEKIKDLNFENLLKKGEALIYKIPVIISNNKAAKSQYQPMFPLSPLFEMKDVSRMILNIYRQNIDEEPKLILQGPIFYLEIVDIR